MTDSDGVNNLRRVATAVLLFAAAAIGLGLVVLALGRTGYGLDRTDEGQYLLLMRDSTDPATVFGLGHLLRPAYLALGGDVHALRLLAVVMTGTFAAGLLAVVAWRVGLAPAAVGAAALAGAGASSIAFAWFPMTPSYNTVALWGCLLAGAGVVLGAGPEAAAPRAGWVVGGLGVALAGAGKPTTGAAALAVLLVAACTARPAPGMRDLPASGSGGTAPGRSDAATERDLPTRGRVGAATGGGSATERDLPDTGRGDAATGPVAAVPGRAAAVAERVAAATARVSGRPTRHPPLTGLALGLCGGVFAYLLLTRRSPAATVDTVLAGVRGVRLLRGHERLLRWDPLEPHALLDATAGLLDATSGPQTLQAMLVVPVAAAVALVVRRRALAPALVLLVLPACYIFGTNGNLWSAAGRAAPLWVAALALASGAHGHTVSAPNRTAPAATEATTSEECARNGAPSRGGARRGDAAHRDRRARATTPHPARTRMAASVATALALTAGVGLAARDTYYRYPDRGSVDTTEAVIDRSGNRLRLNGADARATATLLRDGAPAAGRDVLDTTGASSGYIWQLGANALGSRWLIGGYPGSADAARHALTLAPCERLAAAYVLYSSDSPRRIDQIWADLGLHPRRDYRPIASFTHHLGWRMQLLQPTEAVRHRLRCPA